MLINDLYFLYLHNIFAYITHVVAENGQEQGIFFISVKQPVTLLQILAQQFLRFRLRHVVGQFLSRKFTMSITVVWIVRTVMESLVFLDQFDRQLRLRLIMERCGRFIRFLCRQAGGESDRQHRRHKQPFQFCLTDSHLLSS